MKTSREGIEVNVEKIETRYEFNNKRMSAKLQINRRVIAITINTIKWIKTIHEKSTR